MANTQPVLWAFRFGLAVILACSLSGCLANWVVLDQVLGAADSDRPATQPCAWERLEITSRAETNRDYSKGLVNAQPAYDLGLTGYCVSVAVIDSGLNPTPHRELPRNRVRAEAGIGIAPYSAERRSNIPQNPEYPVGWATSLHGTAVSGVIAAEADGIGMHGVAPGAGIAALNVELLGHFGYHPHPLEFLAESAEEIKLVEWARFAVENASIVNLSLTLASSPLVVEDENQPGVYEARYSAEQLRAAFPGMIAEAAQQDRHPDDRTVFVWAAGNFFGHQDSGAVPVAPELINGMQAIVPELQGHWLSVVAVDENGEIASFSNHCGIAQDWCLAAPGVCIVGPASYAPMVEFSDTAYKLFGCSAAAYNPNDPEYITLSGTSFSAPIVSGALALMMERFRGRLGNTAVVKRMLDTANRTQLYANSDIYGRGLLDIGAAVSEVGLATLDLPSRSLVIDHLPAYLPDSFGLLRQLGGTLKGVEVMTTDALGAPFWHRFETLPGAGLASGFMPSASVPLPLQQKRSAVFGGELHQSRFSHMGFGDAESSGYMLEYRSEGNRLLAAVDVPVNRLTGLHAMPVALGFTDGNAFSLPALKLVSQASRGVGASWRTGQGHLSAMLFQGRAQASSKATSSLGLLEYHWRHKDTHVAIQGGGVFEADSWYGLETEHSLYGHFSARTGFGGLLAATPLTKVQSWHLLGALHSSLTEVQALSAGVLSDATEVGVSRLEVGLVGNALMHPADSLGVSMSWQRMATVARWQLPVDLYRGEVIYADIPVHAESGTRRRLEVQYGSVLFQGTAFALRLGAADDDAGYAALHWRLAF